MPVVAVVGGIASAAAGATAFAAAGGFAAGITAATVASGLAVVGGVATALGGVTGNKKLMKVGMVASLGGASIGGISSLMNRGASAGAGASGLSSAAQPIDAAANSLTNTAVTPAASQLFGDGTSLLGSAPKAMAFDPNALNFAAPTIAVPASAAVVAPVAGSVAQAASPFIATTPSTAMDQAQFWGSLKDSVKPSVSMGGLLGTATDGLRNFGGFLKQNPELTKVGLGVMGAIGEQKMAQDRLDEENRIREDLYRRYNQSIVGQSQAF